MRKNKIVCLTGESGSGKSVLTKVFELRGYKNIDTYTTRKKRKCNEDGHKFIDEGKKDELVKKLMSGDIKDIAYIDNFNGEWYWSLKSQHNHNCNSIYAINPNGIKSLKKNVKDKEIIVIYVKCDESERCRRMLNRVKENEDFYENRIKYEEYIKNRIKYEKDEYMLVECDFIINNNGDINETISTLENLIHCSAL